MIFVRFGEKSVVTYTCNRYFHSVNLCLKIGIYRWVVLLVTD
ncbi:hypothetical protein EC036_33980 [Enterobacter cloacae]|nr:hypothetical protein EC036_33980 [Enterobacter cloacae]